MTALAGEELLVHDPATGQVIGAVPVAQDVPGAVARARAALPGWRRTSPADRAALLKAAAQQLRRWAYELAELQSREGGKPLADSRGGVDAGIAALETYAELAPLHRGRSLQGAWGATDLMVWEPRGVAVVLTPWNDPVAIVLQDLAAALAAGNTVLLKPSERTPLSGDLIGDLLASHLPPDVLQVLHGAGQVGAELAGHPDVDVVLHVGSSATGRAVAQACAATGAKAVLEGGGKDACLVDAGVDPVWAAQQVAVGAFANAGQVCVSVERVYVHEQVAAPLLAALLAEAESRVTGPWDDPRTTMGPLVDGRQRAVVEGHVADAVSAGASVLTGGATPAGPGAFYPPTVLTGCTAAMRVMREETFGPVAAVQVVTSFDEALRAAARSSYGLAAVVLTEDLGHVQQAIRELPVGTVKVNAAFGGAPGGAAHPGRGSGQGFGYGPELLDELSRCKVVHVEPAGRG
ncbi:MAG: gabD [Frankiales bacterium]|nr:gabD [Frankiales bacterium]